MPFPEVIDNSMIATWRSCGRRFFEEQCENLTLPGLDVHLHFGACFAHGLEVSRRAFYIDGKPLREAQAAGSNAAWAQWGDYVVPEGKKTAKNWDTLLLLLDGYFQHWPFNEDTLRPGLGEKAIEFSFAIPLHPSLIHPDSGTPIIYAGRFDMLGQLLSELLIVDEKTTGSAFSGNWSKGWNLRSQFIGYTWACQTMGFNVQRTLVRGCLIQAQKIDFTQAFVPVAEHTIERWYHQTVRDVARMIWSYREGLWDYNLGETCKQYGGCPYQTLCEARNREDWISLYSKKEPWNPLKRPGGEP